MKLLHLVLGAGVGYGVWKYLLVGVKVGDKFVDAKANGYQVQSIANGVVNLQVVDFGLTPTFRAIQMPLDTLKAKIKSGEFKRA